VRTHRQVGQNWTITYRKDGGIRPNTSPPYLPDSDPEQIVENKLAEARQRYSEEAAHTRRLTEALTEYKPVTELEDPANLFPFVYRRQIREAQDAQDNFSYWNSRKNSLFPSGSWHRREWTQSPERNTPPPVYEGPQRYQKQRAKDLWTRHHDHSRIEDDDPVLWNLEPTSIGFIVIDDQKNLRRYFFQPVPPNEHEVVYAANRAVWAVYYDPPFHFELVGPNSVTVVHLPTTGVVKLTLSEFSDALIDEYWPNSPAGESARKHFGDKFDSVHWVQYLLTSAGEAEFPLEADDNWE
jgi:hypothetical protein